MIKEQQLVKALDNSEGIILITEPDGTIVFANKTFEKVYGYTREEVLGKKPSVLKSGFHPKKFYDELWQTLANGNNWSGDLVNRSKSGEIITERASISPIFSDDNAKITGYIAVKYNTSERKKLKAQLEAKEHLFEKLFENSPVGIFMLQALKQEGEVVDFLIDQANLKSSSIFNRISFIGQYLSGVLGNIDVPTLLREHHTEQHGEDVFEWEDLYKRKILEFKLFGLGGVQYCLLVTDVSAKVKMENRLKESEAHLRELNETKDKIFSIIAHDLRSPFQAIIGFASLLNDGIEEQSIPEIKMMARQISNMSEQTYKLLDDLLTWSRSQLGQLKAVPVKLNLKQLVEKCYNQLSMVADKKRIRLNCDVSETLFIKADKDMLEFIVRNLVHNGIKFTRNGGRVRCWAELEGSKALLHVEDTGIGIQEVKQKEIFSLSANLSTSGTSEEAGTGLGLMLSKQMVDLNNGKISVFSEPGKGSRFTISFDVLS
ncbi:PAS domain-containing sensor histidine kinase [Marinilabilia salmonicolor]|uniref:histidine kinase n=1 Tax=Marinilabilia salmonicolor TaxID=989 RepID=A0A368UN50_9BACT|nr:PAS domain-containing sensor histidine kinase [Marinilabilia salmonicolor]RCW30199.1 PAS domain S-box-containing protein [Marinilabilia salmonicolor]